MSKAFSVFPAPEIKLDEPMRPTTAPPTTDLDPPDPPPDPPVTSRLLETGETTAAVTPTTADLTTTSSSSAVSVTVKFLEFPTAKRSYSYGVLEKKWSL